MGFKIKNIVLLIMVLTFSGGALSQEVVDYDIVEWERKENREAIALIYNGQTDLAIDTMLVQLDQTPDRDPEILFGLSLAYSVKQNTAKTFKYFKEALEQGLPLSRFMARMKGFEPLYEHPRFRKRIEQRDHGLVHGPRVGAVSDGDCKIWVRTWTESDVEVNFYKDKKHRKRVAGQKMVTRSDDDYTGVVKIDELVPDTRYYYTVAVDEVLVEGQWSVKTLPPEGRSGHFHVGFGGCSAYNPEFERIWDTIAVHDLDLFLTLGDNVYIDHPESPEVNRFCYYQRQSRPEFQRLTSSIPYLGIWDDHDFGDNDSFGGLKKNEPEWKVEVLKIFKENFANPYYASCGLPGIWYDFSIGDVQFFMLDGRYYRQPSTVDNPTMLGEDQKQWLKKKLLQSDASFKIIVSPVSWADAAKGLMEGRIDTWGGYPQEREEIFSFLEDNGISGVFLLSADRHRHDAWKHEREGHYDLYEFTSSRLTNIHYHQLMPDAMFGYNEKNGFAVLDFHTDAEQPYMVYQVYSIDNELINRIRVYLHQMTTGEDVGQ